MNKNNLERLLQAPERSFFLFGPRGVGKSTWIRRRFGDAVILDLLDTSLQLELIRNPHSLDTIVKPRPPGSWVVLDEIQKVPALLDEVHRLMETRRWRFVLCGSSARKLRRGGANLLAGRAITLEMEPLTSFELGRRFDLNYALEWGLLPVVQLDRTQTARVLSAYVDTYLREELREEGVIRKFEPFARFLSIAGLMNGQVLNACNIAREAMAPRSTVEGYFTVLRDTLLAHFLPAYQPSLKVREAAHPKFFWVDAGIARAATGLLREPADRTWKGASLETLIFHELRVHNVVSDKYCHLAYYRTAAGSEIDFVIETRKRRPNSPPHIVCIEVKLAEKWDRKWERAMRDLKTRSGIVVDRMFGVYTGPRAYYFDGLDVLPVEEFLRQLHQGEVF